MKYKNTTKGILKCRAFDSKLEKKVFKLKPGEEKEFGNEIDFPGLEKVKEKADKKTK